MQPWLIRRRLLRQKKQLCLKEAQDQEPVPSTFVPPVDVASSLVRRAPLLLQPFVLLLEFISVRWLLATTPRWRQIVR